MQKCSLCDHLELEKVFQDRIDYEYNISNRLNYYRCKNSACGFVFVNPLPNDVEIQTFYSKYTTHNSNSHISNLNILAILNKKIKDKELLKLFENSQHESIKILDFGCGNGNLLKDLKKIGINNLFGYDFDSKALQISKFEEFVLFDKYELIQANGNYDFIFLNHVIEHLPHAKNIIENLSKYLNKSGKIIIRTPNSDSLLCFLFKDSWRGWETPRHLGVFNYRNIDLINSSLLIERKWTSNIMFSGIFHESIRVKFLNKFLLGKLVKHLFSYPIYLISVFLNFVFKRFGEEVCIILVNCRTNK